MNTAPDPKDVQEFQFKQASITKIFDAFASIPVACNLVVADKKRGLLYAAQNNKVIILKPGVESGPEWKAELNLPVVTSKLMLNCDCSYLAVAPHGPSVLIYDAQAFAKCNLQLLHEIRISSSNTEVFMNDLRWNPSAPGILCTVASDYTVGSFEIKDKKIIELKGLKRLEGLDVMCAAWSPKGKQIVVGCKNGGIVQLKPDLKVARTIPGPIPYIGEVVSILWISNYQFCAAYLGSEQGINVLIVDAPKGETNAIFTCYEDITYGVSDAEAEGTVPRYYFDHVPEWGLIIAASSSSSDVAVLGSTDGGASWNQWQLVDNGRAELPLVHTTESYPVGLAIDKSPSQKLPWGADAFLPQPVPILHILATSGQLCSFHMVNLTPNCPEITSPPTEIVSAPPNAQTNTEIADASIVVNDLVTSTPRPKQPEIISDRPKPVVSENIFNKFSNKDNGFFAQPPLPEKFIQQEPRKPVAATMEVKLEPPKEAPLKQEPPKANLKLTPIKETVPQIVVEPKPSVEDDARDIRAYIEEHNLFEKELRNKLEPQTWECGTEEECKRLAEGSYAIDQFLKELRETTNSLSSDIAYLKVLLLQSFAWVEETKSKNAANNDITTRGCGDSNKVSDLQKLYYYTQTQLTQASKILDLEWSNRKSQEMSRMKIPHLEFVYQNLIMHHEIIQKEREKLEKLRKQKLELLTRNNNLLGLNRSLSSLNISSSKSSASLPRNAGIIEARCKAIASKTLSFTQGKQAKLREHLDASEPRTIKPVNPSPIQYRVEAALSSLASANALAETSIETRSKVDESVSKQPSVAKESVEKPKQQSPLASLDSFVAGIGTSEGNTTPTQSKAQTKQPVFNIVLQPAAGNKLQTEKKPTTPTATAVPQAAKPKQDTVTFSQVNTPAYSLLNLMKSFPKVDSISFGTPTQKTEDISAQKTTPKETSAKPIKEAVTTNDSFKVETLAGKAPGIPTNNTALNNNKYYIEIKPTSINVEPTTTFSFATTSIPAATAKGSPQNALTTSQTSSAQTFSFASKPSGNASPFNLIITPTSIPPQRQDSLSLTGLFTGLQATNQTPNVASSNLSADAKYNYKPTFGTSGFPTSLGQISVTPATTTPTKEVVAITPSVTLEKIPSTKAKTPSFPASPVQAPPATSAIPPFGASVSTPSISIFGGVSTPTPATTAAASFAVTTSTFGTPVTTTLPMTIFSGFGTAPVTSTTSTVAPTTTTMAPFYSTLPKPTFGEAATNLSTASTTSSTPATITFGTVTATTTTTSATNIFGKPALTMNAQFPSTPVTSAATSVFEKPIISPTSMPFGSSTNTNIFGGAPPATSTSGSMFSGGNTDSIFGATTPASSPGSIFGRNASMNTFGTPQKNIFDNSPQKSPSIFDTNATNTGSTSFFGGTANNTNQAGPVLGSPNVFGDGVAPNASPMGLEQPALAAQPAFGQAPAFDAKPVFGSQPTFGAKPIFGGGFGNTAFGGTVAPPAFGSPPMMGAAPVPIDNSMPKVFGSVGGNNTFESLANQPDGLSFSSLAQKSPEQQKPPAFSSGSSFSSWR